MFIDTLRGQRLKILIFAKLPLFPEAPENIHISIRKYIYRSRTTLSQDAQTQSSVQLAFAKFLSKIKGNF